MKTAIELLLAAEVIKRAEELRDRDAGRSAALARRDGSDLTVDTLRAQFKQEHPYQEYLEKALDEMGGVAELIRQRLSS